MRTIRANKRQNWAARISVTASRIFIFTASVCDEDSGKARMNSPAPVWNQPTPLLLGWKHETRMSAPEKEMAYPTHSAKESGSDWE